MHLSRRWPTPDWRPEIGLPRPDAEPLAAVTCRDFSPKGVLPPMVARRLDRPARLLAVAAREALAPFGETLPWDRERVGVTAGTWTAGTTSLVEVLRAVFMTSPEEAPPAEFPSTVANAAASQLGILEHLGGPNLTFAEKQVGGLRAVLEAARMIGHGRADAVLAAGVDEAHWLNVEGYERLGSLRRGNGPGMLLGEGAAVALLTGAPSATALARLAGTGSAGSAVRATPLPGSPRRPGHRLSTGSRQRRPGQPGRRAGPRPGQRHPERSTGSRWPPSPPCSAATARRRSAITDRLGEGAFASAVRLLVAALTVGGRIEPSWGPGAALADAGFSPLARRPRVALIAGQASGGSAVALVVTAL